MLKELRLKFWNDDKDLGVNMLKKTIFAGLTILGLTLTAGCASKANDCAARKSSCAPKETSCEPQANTCGKPQQNKIVAYGNFDPVVIRVNGYGTHGKTDVQTNTSQRKLLAMRASKMDAYRNLAERVYGTRIQGNTTVQNLATRDDSIRGYVDNLVRGAKVVSTNDLGNGSYETLMELVLEPRFQHCMVRNESMAADPRCTQHTVHGEHPSQRLPISQHQPRARYHLN